MADVNNIGNKTFRAKGASIVESTPIRSEVIDTGTDVVVIATTVGPNTIPYFDADAEYVAHSVEDFGELIASTESVQEELDKAAADAATAAAAAATQTALNAASRAEAAAESAGEFGDNKMTFQQTPTDPTGTIAGLAATTDGKYFRVAIKDADGIVVSFNYYRNTAGVAEYINSLPSSRAIQGMRDTLAIPIQNMYTSLHLTMQMINELRDREQLTSEQAQRSLVAMHQMITAINALALQLDVTDATASANTDKMGVAIPALLTANHALVQAISLIIPDVDNSNSYIQRLYTAIQIMQETVNEVSTIPDTTTLLQLNLLRSISTIGVQLMPLEGFDPTNVIDQDTLAAAVQAFMTPERAPTQFCFQTPQSCIRMDFTTADALPANKDAPDAKGQLKFNIDGAAITLYTTLSVQGATSANYPKKNFTMKFYTDSTKNTSALIKLGNILPHDRLVYKANWIDVTHARNAISYALWQQVIDARKVFPKNVVELTQLGKYGTAGQFNGANGHPTLFPCVMFVNGEFYGIGSVGTAKRYPNYNLEKNSPLQIQLDQGTWTPMNKWGDAITTGGIEYGAPSKPTADTAAAVARWDAWATNVMSGSVVDIDDYINKSYLIDFMLFVEFIHAADLISNNNIKNVQVVSYDGLIWHFFPYDLDTDYGMNWDGKTLTNTMNASYFNGTFWPNIISSIGLSNFSARYAELRREGIFTESNVYSLLFSLQTKYSAELFSAEFSKWPTVPSLAITSPEQILTWVRGRITYLDTKYNFTN